MECSKLKTYKGIIEYLLQTTHFTIKNIADLSKSSVETIQSIRDEKDTPQNFSAMCLILLYQITVKYKNYDS